MAATIPVDHLLADLNPAQLEAVRATSGPVAILAGAGTGKTRVISRRAAYAIATGVVPRDAVLVVTFTDKAAAEMAERLRRLGCGSVTARTFHAHALSQIRHFWPSRHDGEALPDVLESKAPILVPLARHLPGHYRFTAVKDLADEVEWAKSRRIEPRAYQAAAADRQPPIPPDLMARVYADYERAKQRANRLDFDDMLTLTVDLLETDEAAAETVRARKRWFSVDEYQDTNPLQQRLLELWLGERDDLCVVGDADQTIYSFTGATSTFLTGFASRHPGTRVVELTENYRSTPQILAAANRLIGGGGGTKRLTATHGDGPEPRILRFPDADAELAALVADAARLVREGIAPGEIAVLVRTNAQLVPLEDAFTRAGIAYRVRGVRFYDRPEVRGAVLALARGSFDVTGPDLLRAIRLRWRAELGFELAAEADEGRAERERQAALDTLMGILEGLVAADPEADRERLLADLRRRAENEREGSADGVNLLTYHRAKGLEWDAVFLPNLEDGSLPIRQAFDDAPALAEERRLLYVGITRARRHLALSWAERREVRGRESRRQPSRFLRDIEPRTPRRIVTLAGPAVATRPTPRGGDADDPLVAALRAWRLERARTDDVPAFVVAHDSMLAAIADARPESLAALRRVKGMGPTKLERYGDEILAVLARSNPNGR